METLELIPLALPTLNTFCFEPTADDNTGEAGPLAPRLQNLIDSNHICRLDPVSVEDWPTGLNRAVMVPHHRVKDESPTTDWVAHLNRWCEYLLGCTVVSVYEETMEVSNKL